jgi:RNA polymerase sigma-70 factor (ECF subfamily)
VANASRQLSEAARLELASACQRASAGWPQLKLPLDAFLRYAAERVPANATAAAIEKVELSDLYLAFGCNLRHAGALREFERHHMSQVARHIASIDATRGTVDEVSQQLRHRLLVGEDGQGGRITEYTGRGPLAGWVRVAAVRAALNHKRTQTRQREQELESELIGEVDPELAVLKREAATEVAQAIRAAIGLLEVEDRTLLKLHYLNGMGIDQLAPLFKAHRSTLARRLERARERVLELTREQLAQVGNRNASQLKSILRLARSQLDVSIPSIFRER